MNTSKYITVVIGNDNASVAEPITRVDYGLKLRIKGVALPATYEVDFSLSEKGGESVTVIGDAQGAEIPVDHIKTGKNIFAYLYWTGEDYGRRVKKIMIPNDAGPDRTDITPEPAQQSVIDQTIAALNEAVSNAPRIGDDGYWYVWDPEEGDYVSTGDKASAGLHTVRMWQDTFVINTDAEGYVRKTNFTRQTSFAGYIDGEQVPVTMRFWGASQQGINWNVNWQATAERLGQFEVWTPVDTKPLTQLSPSYRANVYFDFEDGTTVPGHINFHVVRDGAEYTLTEEDKQEIADMVDIPLVVEDGLLCAVYEEEIEVL